MIQDSLGRPPTINDLVDGSIELALNKVYDSGQTIYTNAFILCANNAFGRVRKHQNHLELFKLMFLNSGFAGRILLCKKMRDAVDLLKTFPLIGDFMAYQLAVDLSYLDFIDFNDDDLAVTGPGASRGISKAFSSTGFLTKQNIISQVWRDQEAWFAHYDIDFPWLNGRRLDLVDCQGLFCELDKYCRVAIPELQSARSRIKAKFKKPSHKITAVLPKKWTLG